MAEQEEKSKPKKTMGKKKAGKPPAREEEIETPKALELWLRKNSAYWTLAIAARTALRVLPRVFHGFESRDWALPSREKKQLALQTFRACFITWVACRYWNEDIGRPANNARAAAAGVMTAIANATELNAIAIYVAQIAADAARTADADAAAARMGRDSAAAEYKKAVAFAIDVVAKSAAETNNSQIWDAINADIFWGNSHSDKNVISQPLWIIEVRERGYEDASANFPRWASIPLDEFDRGVRPSSGAWELIIDWYRALLRDNLEAKPRSAFGERVDHEIAIKDDDFWGRDPDLVMADIAEIVGWKTSTPSPRPEPPSPRIIDNTGLHGDQPTSDDKLGRRTFARGLVETIDRVQAEQHVWLAEERAKLKSAGRLDNLEGDGFAVHLHAPWGAGKTSVLKMMENYMTSPSRADTDRWIVVNFNAWRHERRHPPWWPLIEAVYGGCREHLIEMKRHRKAFDLREYWQFFNFWAWAGPYVIAFFLVGIAVTQIWNLQQAAISGDSFGLAKTIFSIVSSAITVFGASYVFGRQFVFGSNKDADIHAEHSHDPLKRVKKRFETLINKTGAPVAVFIDDLDRCDGKFVADLLEGIQTAFRHENVVYVVAADKNWIRTSFETCYKEFKRPADDVGQSLGYLFLEKIFQISTPVPGMSDRLHADYLQMLLESGEKPPAQDEDKENTSQPETLDESDLSVEDFDALVDEKRVQLKEFAPKGVTRESADRWLKENKAASDRAAVGLAMIQSQAAQKDFEYRLNNFRHLLPDNPRVMKRLVNAYGFRNLIGYSENNDIDPDQLARWTILEQRFPAAADLFTEHPDWIDKIGPDAPDPADKTMSARLKLFANSSAIREVVRKGDGSLTSDVVAAITRGSRR